MAIADGINMTPTADSQDMLDLLKIATKAYPWRGQLDVMQDLHRYPVMNLWFAKHKVQFQSGTSITHDVMIDDNGTFRMVEPYEKDTTSVKDVMAKLEIPWRLSNAYYVVEFTELSRNRKPEQLVSLLKIRRAAMELSIADGLESKAWLAPATTSDVKEPYGIPYHFPPITSAQVSASSGGAHIGSLPLAEDGNSFSTWCGIDTSDTKYARVRSYCDVWTNDSGQITENDVQKIIKMHRHLHFVVPLNQNDWQSPEFRNYQGYCGEDLLDAMDIKARANNESLGSDLAKFAGAVVVKGTPVSWVEKLDDETTYPFFLINHNHFFPFVMSGDYFRETGPRIHPDYHRVTRTDVDLQFNFGVRNRRLAGGRIDYVA